MHCCIPAKKAHFRVSIHSFSPVHCSRTDSIVRTAIIFKRIDRWLLRPQSSKGCERNILRKGKKLIWSVFSQIRSFVKNASNSPNFLFLGCFLDILCVNYKCYYEGWGKAVFSWTEMWFSMNRLRAMCTATAGDGNDVNLGIAAWLRKTGSGLGGLRLRSRPRKPKEAGSLMRIALKISSRFTVVVFWRRFIRGLLKEI